MPADRSVIADDRLMQDDQSSSTERSFDVPPLLLEYWQIVMRWKWLIAAIIGASVVVGLILSRDIKPGDRITTREVSLALGMSPVDRNLRYAPLRNAAM